VKAMGLIQLMDNMIGWKIPFIGMIYSITGIGIIISLWNLIEFDLFSILSIIGLIICHLALIMFFEELIAFQSYF
jgi:hypothetical protein